MVTPWDFIMADSNVRSTLHVFIIYSGSKRVHSLARVLTPTSQSVPLIGQAADHCYIIFTLSLMVYFY